MKLTIIGSASAEPNPGGASSCYLIQAAERQVVLECGHGASSKLFLHTTFEQIGAVLISHMHPDHFFDLVPLKYLITFNRLPHLRLVVPPTGPDVLSGIAKALSERPSFWTSAFDIEVFQPEEGLELEGISISFQRTHHYIPAWAMRFQERGDTGRVLAYTSDTSRTEEIQRFVGDADLLLAEASIEHQTKDASDQGHLTPEDAAHLADSGDVGELVLTHYPAGPADHILAQAAAIFRGRTSLAVEGNTYLVTQRDTVPGSRLPGR